MVRRHARRHGGRRHACATTTGCRTGTSMYSAQVLTQDLYPRVITILRELAGGALIMLPSSIEDFADPELARSSAQTQRASKMEPDEKVKFMKAAWDAVGSEFGSRHTQYEMFYAGAKFVTTGHSFRTFDWPGATGMVDQLMSTYDLAGELEPRQRRRMKSPRSSPRKRGPSSWPDSRLRGNERERLMKVAICNLGQIVSGDWHDPFVAGDTIVTDGGRIVSVGTAAAASRRQRRRGDRCRRHDGDPRPDRLRMCTSPSATTRRASAPSVIWKAICMAASPRRSRPRKCMCPAARAIPKASRRWRSRRSAALRTIGPAACG